MKTESQGILNRIMLNNRFMWRDNSCNLHGINNNRFL